MFDSPQLATYTSYLKALNAKNPTTKTSVLETSTKKYGEEGLLTMLVTGQNAKSTGATKLKDEMVQSWLEFSTPPANVFKTLKLDQARDELLSSPLLSTWVQYMKAFIKVVPRKETSMIETFTKSYGEKKLATMLQAAKKVPSTEELATNLQRAQLKQWMVKKKSPDDIYKTVLKLDSTSDASADIWRAYYKAYDKEFPGQLFSFNP